MFTYTTKPYQFIILYIIAVVQWQQDLAPSDHLQEHPPLHREYRDRDVSRDPILHPRFTVETKLREDCGAAQAIQGIHDAGRDLHTLPTYYSTQPQSQPSPSPVPADWP